MVLLLLDTYQRASMTTTRQVVHLRLDRELYQRIKQRAADEDRPIAKVIERTLRQAFVTVKRKGR